MRNPRPLAPSGWRQIEQTEDFQVRVTYFRNTIRSSEQGRTVAYVRQIMRAVLLGGRIDSEELESGEFAIVYYGKSPSECKHFISRFNRLMR